MAKRTRGPGPVLGTAGADRVGPSLEAPTPPVGTTSALFDPRRSRGTTGGVNPFDFARLLCSGNTGLGHRRRPIIVCSPICNTTHRRRREAQEEGGGHVEGSCRSTDPSVCPPRPGLRPSLSPVAPPAVSSRFVFSLDSCLLDVCAPMDGWAVLRGGRGWWWAPRPPTPSLQIRSQLFHFLFIAALGHHRLVYRALITSIYPCMMRLLNGRTSVTV